MEKSGCGAVERDWSAWIPLSVVKSSKGDMRIGGIASDEESPDLQGEKVFVDGLDTSYLLQRGAFNWDHQKGPEDILGEIDTVQKDNKKLYVEGFLYPKVKKAVDVYDLMQSLKESRSTRKLGLSLEGKVKERDTKDTKVIKKAWIKNVAITYNPINQGAWVDMIKSMGNFTFEKCDKDCSHCPLCEVKEETKVVKAESKELPSFIIHEGIKYFQKDFGELKKAGEGGTGPAGSGGAAPNPPQSGGLSAGHDIPSSSGGISGSALRRQSLDKKKKKTTYDEKQVGDVKPDTGDKDDKKKKKMDKSQVLEFIKAEGHPENIAVVLTDLVFAMKEAAPILEKSSESAKKAWITRHKGMGKQKGKKKLPHGTSERIDAKHEEYRQALLAKEKKDRVKGPAHDKAGNVVQGKKSPYSRQFELKEKRVNRAIAKIAKPVPKELPPTGSAKLVAHEVHRITSMSDKALINRATKITDPTKMKNFYVAASLKQNPRLAERIQSEGKRLGLSPKDFSSNLKATRTEFEHQLAA